MEISGTTARCMERHSKVVLEMKAVLVDSADSYDDDDDDDDVIV